MTEVTGKSFEKARTESQVKVNEILASQGFDRSRRSTYSACVCHTPLLNPESLTRFAES